MAHKVPFIVAKLGADADPFMLHIYAALAEQERRMISQPAVKALVAKRAQGVRLANPTSLPPVSASAEQAVNFFHSHQFKRTCGSLGDDSIT